MLNQDVYDSENVFAKILKGEIPCKQMYENDDVLAFKDINPAAPFHILVIPKSSYVGMSDFTQKASDHEILTLMRAVGEIAAHYNLDETGYKVQVNCGEGGGQEVPHLHLHIMANNKI